LDGIGIWEQKLPASDAEALELLEASGLGSASAIPEVPSILPLPLLPGPDDPAERVEAFCASLHRLAQFRPSGIVCVTGPPGDRDPDEARATVVAGLRTIAAEAERAGVRIALEPFQREGAEDWAIVTSIPEAVALIEDAGDPPALGIQFDVWHLWNTETLLDDIAREHHRFVGVHVEDWREPTRSWCDRVLPGDGAADLPAILGALDAAGWDGFYDLEIFSDDGTFGNAFRDSLWRVPPVELARRGRESLERAWAARQLSEPAGGRTL
jgi:sugar phosphate isomerase/epimerase